MAIFLLPSNSWIYQTRDFEAEKRNLLFCLPDWRVRFGERRWKIFDSSAFWGIHILYALSDGLEVEVGEKKAHSFISSIANNTQLSRCCLRQRLMNGLIAWRRPIFQKCGKFGSRQQHHAIKRGPQTPQKASPSPGSDCVPPPVTRWRANFPKISMTEAA